MEGSDDVHVHKFSISRGGKPLFKDCPLSLAHGRRYGLIGPNGCGKSTLMTAIGKQTNEEIMAGIPPQMDILLVEQEVAASKTISAVEMVVLADERRTALLKEEKELTKQLEEGGVKYVQQEKLKGESFEVGAKVTFEGRAVTILEGKDHEGDYTIQDAFDEDGAIAGRLTEVHEELTDIGADSAEARASAILTGLQFLEEQKSWPTASFSGGWRMRLSLARALFRKPRLLLLDEPTNHLDLHAVLWLETYLQSWQKTLVVVSHARSFLNSVCTDILHFQNKSIARHVGAVDWAARRRPTDGLGTRVSGTRATTTTSRGPKPRRCATTSGSEMRRRRRGRTCRSSSTSAQACRSRWPRSGVPEQHPSARTPRQVPREREAGGDGAVAHQDARQDGDAQRDPGRPLAALQLP